MAMLKCGSSCSRTCSRASCTPPWTGTSRSIPLRRCDSDHAGRSPRTTIRASPLPIRSGTRARKGARFPPKACSSGISAQPAGFRACNWGRGGLIPGRDAGTADLGHQNRPFAVSCNANERPYLRSGAGSGFPEPPHLLHPDGRAILDMSWSGPRISSRMAARVGSAAGHGQSLNNAIRNGTGRTRDIKAQTFTERTGIKAGHGFAFPVSDGRFGVAIHLASDRRGICCLISAHRSRTSVPAPMPCAPRQGAIASRFCCGIRRLRSSRWPRACLWPLCPVGWYFFAVRAGPRWKR
jgi:hypothetical protein